MPSTDALTTHLFLKLNVNLQFPTSSLFFFRAATNKSRLRQIAKASLASPWLLHLPLHLATQLGVLCENGAFILLIIGCSSHQETVEEARVREATRTSWS